MKSMFLVAIALLAFQTEDVMYEEISNPPNPCRLTVAQDAMDSACLSGSWVVFTPINPIRPITADGPGCEFYGVGYWMTVWNGHTGEIVEDRGYRWSGHVPCGWSFHHFEVCPTCDKFIGQVSIICHPKE